MNALELIVNEHAVTAFLAALNVVQVLALAHLTARTEEGRRRRKRRRPPA